MKVFYRPMKQIGEESITLCDLSIPFGLNHPITIKRTASIEIKSDPKKTKALLAEIQLTFQGPNHQETKTKIYFINSSGVFNAV